jgi:DNA-binding ferritin-like protein
MPKKNHFADKIAALGTKPAKVAKNAVAQPEAKEPAVRRVKDKAGDFVRLAEKRHFAAIEEIRRIGNLANTSNYTSTADQVAMIFDSLQEELNAARALFKVADRKQKRGPLKLVA